MNQEWLESLVYRSPFHQLLGFTLDSVDESQGEVTFSLEPRPELSKSDNDVEFHYGVIAALIDIAGDYAVAIIVENGVPTINLRIDYIESITTTKIIAKARARHIDSLIGTVDVSVETEEGILVAIGRGTYSSRKA